MSEIKYEPIKASEYIAKPLKQVEDLARQVAALTKTVEKLQEQLDNKVSSSVITQALSSLQTQINSKVGKDDVIESINLSNESILITGKKINVDTNTMIRHGAVKR